jgi:hypothetical protein
MAGVQEQAPDRKAIPRDKIVIPNARESKLATDAALLLGYGALRQKLNIPGELGEVLARLEIQPLNSAAVKQYKWQMVQWRIEELRRLGLLYYSRSTLADPAGVILHHTDVRWSLQLISNYREEIPLFALRKAIDVKKSCPESILMVDALTESTRVVDPFLIASLLDEFYYIEVWGESKFEATL